MSATHPHTLDVRVSESGLASEHARILRSLVRRGDEAPERTPQDILPEGRYHPEAIALARANWLDRMVHEHESASVFSGCLPHLMAAGAPLDVKTTLMRCAIDELRHAGLCGQVVEFLGGEPLASANLVVGAPPVHKDCSARVGALRNVIFASLSETISVALLTAEREVVTEPFLKRVLKQLSGDEILHARVGWIYLAITLPLLTPAEREDLCAYTPIALAHLQDCMLSAMPLDPGARPAEPILADALALGFSYSEHTRALFFGTMEQVVVPQLDAFKMGAASAWETIRGDR